MFLRRKQSGRRVYLQVVENRWEGGRSRQRVIATLGRLDTLLASGELDSLVRSAARFSEALLVLDAHGAGETPVVRSERVGPALVFQRLWQETGCQAVVQQHLAQRQFGFPVERAVFLTVLHRLLAPGSDRAAERWRALYRLPGTESLQLHQLYRAMAWLGEALPAQAQAGCTPFTPRCIKDLIEEDLFGYRRDLFTALDLVFFDTTSLYFEGEGGETLGQYGHSKDHRPDLKQRVVGAVLDSEGHPVCCELWPGNACDVTSLVPIVERLRTRFAIGELCVVADRGMISQHTLAELEARGWRYILGARMRRHKEVREEVLARAGRYRVVHPPGVHAKDPAPLRVKEVNVEGRRYVVCLNEAQKRKDEADRQGILAALGEKLKQGDKALIGNRGYRKYLASQGERFVIDEQAVRREARYDGKWVLRTNTELSTAEVALKYKQLWMVEDLFRTSKSLLATRPIFHRCDETIRGHVFCSFLALILRKELQARLEARGESLEWDDIVRDLEALTETEVLHEGKRFRLRAEAQRTCGKVFQAVGVALPPTVRRLEDTAQA